MNYTLSNTTATATATATANITPKALAVTGITANDKTHDDNTTATLVHGHRVAVKGLYIEGTPARINLTSVVDLGPSCP